MTRRLAVAGRAGADGADVSNEAIARRLASGEYFWLDLHGLDDDDLALLRDTFGLHPLVLEDVQGQGQRAKVEEYGDMTYIVAFGATPPPDHDRLVEVHLLYSEHFLLTLHRDASPAIDDVVHRCSIRPELLEKGPLLLYRVLDALTDSFFPAMDELDSDIDAIDSALSTSPRDGLQGEIFELRRRVVSLRRAVTPQRDQISRIATGAVELPGVDADARRYFRDIEDHLIRIAELLDGYRDLLAGANDVYLATVSNRLNAVTKQLTVIAGIFLPLSFITGFFGQNFGWMVDHVGGPGCLLRPRHRPSGRRHRRAGRAVSPRQVALVSRVASGAAVPGCIAARCGVLGSPNILDIGADLRPEERPSALGRSGRRAAATAAALLACDSLGNCSLTYDSGH